MRRVTTFLATAAATCAVAVGMSTAGTASAVVPEPRVEVVPVGEPAPVAPGEYGYTATHALTVRASTSNLAQFVASIPVPTQYRAANLALAARFDATVAEALTSPGGCVQIIVDPRSVSGNLFDYGFFAVAGAYCD